MNEVVVDLHDNEETMYSYQIRYDGAVHRIWKSTGPVSGHYLPEEFYTVLAAMRHLADHIDMGEM